MFRNVDSMTGKEKLKVNFSEQWPTFLYARLQIMYCDSPGKAHQEYIHLYIVCVPKCTFYDRKIEIKS